MQIAEGLARGVPVAPMESVPGAQKVLYFDFEMSEKQFEARYSMKAKNGNLYRPYKFPENLLRAQMAPHDNLPPGYKNLTEFLQFSFQELLRETQAKVVIVDNITFLKGANENAGAAAQLMKALKYIKQCYGISILVLAHTPKLPFTSPLSLNDMQGSKMLSNFADNIFAIGGSHQDKDLRYLKHLKPRNTGITYDVSKVILYRLVKNKNFLQFEFAGYAKERDHLAWHYESSDGERAKLIIMAKKLYAVSKSQRRVAMIMGVSLTTVNRYLKAAAPDDEDILKEEDISRMQDEIV